MTQSYPAGLPLPLVSEYSVEVSHGLTSVTFERGNTRQRRGVSLQRHVFGLSMTLTVPELWEWQSWANAYGYDWHYMDLTSSYAGSSGDNVIPHLVRYIGDVSLSFIDFDHVRVAVQAEMDVASLPVGTVVPSGNWYIGGTPASPSNSNAVIAGSPGSPSSSFIIAGTPSVPAA
jgi:hypothetical protein